MIRWLRRSQYSFMWEERALQWKQGMKEAAIFGCNNAEVFFSKSRRKTLRMGRMCFPLRRLYSLFFGDSRGAWLQPSLGKSFYSWVHSTWLPLRISRNLGKRKLSITLCLSLSWQSLQYAKWSKDINRLLFCGRCRIFLEVEWVLGKGELSKGRGNQRVTVGREWDC